jgi:nitroreductase
MPVELVLHQDEYGDPADEEVDAYDRTMAEYYSSRGPGAKVGDWSGATSRAVQGKKREHMLDFMRRRGFFVR